MTHPRVWLALSASLALVAPAAAQQGQGGRFGLAQALDPERSPGDAFHLRGRELYLQLPNGVGRSKLTNAYLDRTLEVVSTARNWRTTLAVLALVEGD